MNRQLIRGLALLIVLAMSIGAVTQRVTSTPEKWCAPPRSQDPLLGDAVRVGTAGDERSVRERRMYHISQVPRESIVIVREEATCRQAAGAYGGILRKSVDAKIPDKPVLVVRVGDVYFVDDLRSRKGRDAYWEAMVFNAQWQRVWGYGAGGDNPNSLRNR